MAGWIPSMGSVAGFLLLASACAASGTETTSGAGAAQSERQPSVEYPLVGPAELVPIPEDSTPSPQDDAGQEANGGASEKEIAECVSLVEENYASRGSDPADLAALPRGEAARVAVSLAEPIGRAEALRILQKHERFVVGLSIIVDPYIQGTAIHGAWDVMPGQALGDALQESEKHLTLLLEGEKSNFELTEAERAEVARIIDEVDNELRVEGFIIAGARGEISQAVDESLDVLEVYSVVLGDQAVPLLAPDAASLAAWSERCATDPDFGKGLSEADQHLHGEHTHDHDEHSHEPSLEGN